MKIVVMGPQGSGKGTVAEKLAEIYNIPTISTGELFRQILKENSPVAEELREYMNAGALVPDELTIKILSNRLQEKDCKNGYILDGFPRTMEQVHKLEDITQIDKVLYLDVAKDIILERIGGRRTCPKCGHIHNIKFAGDPNNCSVCGTPYVIRSDDTAEAIENRLKQFYEKTYPIVEYFKGKNLVISVDAGKNPEYTLSQALEGLATKI